MGINLIKGQKIDLTKHETGLSEVLVGLGWNINDSGHGEDYDLDASAFLLGINGRVLSDYDLVFFNNLEHSSGSVRSMGDNRTGGSEGDDEQIKVDLSKVPARTTKIVFTVTIYEAKKRKQNFGQVSNAYIRVLNAKNYKELLRYNLNEKFSTEMSVIAAELYRSSGGWTFNALGEGFNGEIDELCKRYGLSI